MAGYVVDGAAPVGLGPEQLAQAKLPRNIAAARYSDLPHDTFNDPVASAANPQDSYLDVNYVQAASALPGSATTPGLPGRPPTPAALAALVDGSS